MSETRQSARRRARAMHDRGERVALFVAFGVIVLLALGFIVFLIISRTMAANPSLAVNTPPRNLDLWAIYPDGRVRFATLFYPDDRAFAESGTIGEETVDTAGPLVASEADILSSEVLGGDEESMNVLPGPGDDSALVYPLFTLTRIQNGDPYGVDVMTAASPYVTAGELALDDAPAGTQIISLGIGDLGQNAQVIVAVAFPRGAEVEVQEGEGNLENYRKVNIGGWAVYYFNSSVAQPEDAIRIHFVLDDDQEATNLDVIDVDRRR